MLLIPARVRHNITSLPLMSTHLPQTAATPCFSGAERFHKGIRESAETGLKYEQIQEHLGMVPPVFQHEVPRGLVALLGTKPDCPKTLLGLAVRDG